MALLIQQKKCHFPWKWQTYSLWAWVLAGDVEVDEVLTNNDVGDAITIISNLKIPRRKDFRVADFWKGSPQHHNSWWLTGPKPPPEETYSGCLTRSKSSNCCRGVWLVDNLQGSDSTCTPPGKYHVVRDAAADSFTTSSESLVLERNYWGTSSITTIILRIISIEGGGGGVEDKLKSVCEAITHTVIRTGTTFRVCFVLENLHRDLSMIVCDLSEKKQQWNKTPSHK